LDHWRFLLVDVCLGLIDHGTGKRWPWTSHIKSYSLHRWMLIPHDHPCFIRFTAFEVSWSLNKLHRNVGFIMIYKYMFIYGFIKIRDKLWNCWIYTVYTVVCCGFAHPFHGSRCFKAQKAELRTSRCSARSWPSTAAGRWVLAVVLGGNMVLHSGITAWWFGTWLDDFPIWVCLNMLCTPFYPMVLLIIIPIKSLFHWEYTLFSDKPIYWEQWSQLTFIFFERGRYTTKQ